MPIERIRANTFKELPAFESVLSSYHENLTSEQHKKIVVISINKEDRTAAIVVSSDYDTHAFHNVKTLIEKDDLQILLHIMTDPSVIEQIVDNGANNSNQAIRTSDESQAKKDFEDLVKGAVQSNAQDIHIFLSPGNSFVKFRVNKRLRDFSDFEYKTLFAMVAAAYNTLADEDSKGSEEFGEKDYFQTVIPVFFRDIGRYRLRFQSSPKFPSGTKVVLRILHIEDDAEKDIQYQDLSQQGFELAQTEILEKASLRKKGMIVVAGETGSGKTTTVHKLLTNKMYRDPWLAINTVEDPPEYVLAGCTQTPVKGGGIKDGDESPFALALKANLRLDPDIIFSGETRDTDTAIVGQSAVGTGHLVFTTLHTSSAIDVVQRLVDLGVDRKVLGKDDFLSVVLFQDLLPTICPSCKVPLTQCNDHSLIERTRILMGDLVDQLFAYDIDEGCNQCSGSGVAGMSVAAELLVPEGKTNEAIYNGEDVKAKYLWLESHKKLMGEADGEYSGVLVAEHAIYKMMKGIFSPADVEATFGHFSLLKKTLERNDAWILKFIKEKQNSFNKKMDHQNKNLDHFFHDKEYQSSDEKNLELDHEST